MEAHDYGALLTEIDIRAKREVFVKVKDGIFTLDFQNLKVLDYNNFVLVCKNAYFNKLLGITKERFFKMLQVGKQYHSKYFLSWVAKCYIPIELPLEKRQEILASSPFANEAIEDMEMYFAENPSMITFAWEFAKAKIATEKSADAREKLDNIKRHAYFNLLRAAEFFSQLPPAPNSDNLPLDFDNGKSPFTFRFNCRILTSPQTVNFIAMPSFFVEKSRADLVVKCILLRDMSRNAHFVAHFFSGEQRDIIRTRSQQLREWGDYISRNCDVFQELYDYDHFRRVGAAVEDAKRAYAEKARTTRMPADKDFEAWLCDAFPPAFVAPPPEVTDIDSLVSHVEARANLEHKEAATAFCYAQVLQKADREAFILHTPARMQGILVAHQRAKVHTEEKLKAAGRSLRDARRELNAAGPDRATDLNRAVESNEAQLCELEKQLEHQNLLITHATTRVELSTAVFILGVQSLDELLQRRNVECKDRPMQFEEHYLPGGIPRGFTIQPWLDPVPLSDQVLLNLQEAANDWSNMEAYVERITGNLKYINTEAAYFQRRINDLVADISKCYTFYAEM